MPSRTRPVEIPAATRPTRVPAGERLYVIGDIHGRLDLLIALVTRIRRDSEARGPARVRIVLLGDLIDRGPDSAGVVDICRSLAARSTRFVVLKGNHEAMMVDGVRGNFNAFSLWLRHGGDAALRSWGADPAILEGGASHALVQEARRRIPAEVLGWLDALPPSHVAGDYLLVHAGIRPEVPIAGQSLQDMMWIRREFLESEADHRFIVVHGHSVSECGVVVRPNRIGIDTGAYRTDVLTALALEADRRWTLATDGADAATGAAAGRPDADILALLGEDDGADTAPAPRAWPQAGVAAFVLAGAMSLAAVMLLRSPAPPVVQRYEIALPGVTAPGGARVAMPPASPAARAAGSPPADERRAPRPATPSPYRSSSPAVASEAPSDRTASPAGVDGPADTRNASTSRGSEPKAGEAPPTETTLLLDPGRDVASPDAASPEAAVDEENRLQAQRRGDAIRSLRRQ